MAYVETYTCNFTNERNQLVEISFLKKDGTATEVVNYPCISAEISVDGEEQSKYDCILARELSVTMLIPEWDQAIDWDTFMSDNYDDWKVIVTIDGTRTEFIGFIAPEEGSVAMQDKPYELTIKATTGIGLLKGIDLSDVNGDRFDGEYTLIEYLAGALKKTQLDIPIRIYCSYFNIAILNKDNGLEYDMFGQTFLDYRTFQKDVTTPVSCYDAIKIILDKFCTIEFYDGCWQIVSIADKQYLRGDWFFVEYDSNGENPSGVQATDNYMTVGKDQLLFPVQEDQLKSSRFAVKSVKSKYNYEVWPEIPKNNKFERGTQIGSGTNPDLTTYKTFSIDDWDQGEVDLFDLPHPAMSTVTEKFYRKSSYNSYGIELLREIIGETRSADDLNHSLWLRSKGVPVKRGNKIKFNIQKRFDNDFSSGSSTFTIPAVIYIVSGSTAYYLDNNVGGAAINTGTWRIASNLAGQLVIQYPPNSDTRENMSIDVTSQAIPVDGTMYIALSVDGPISNTGANQYYSDFDFHYLPFIAGGYVAVKGDYYQRTQTANYPDIIDENIKISDSPQKVFQGALLFDNGGSALELTEQNWYRFKEIGDANPGPEAFGFKDLLNLGRLNHQWRRMVSVEGTFCGLTYTPQNDSSSVQCLGFHQKFRMVNLSVQRDFILVSPFKMDLVSGFINALFVEVSKDGDDGTQLDTSQELKYIF